MTTTYNADDLYASGQRVAAAGDGLSRPAGMMAILGVSFDEYVMEIAGTDPALVARALDEIGMTRTAALLRSQP